MQRGRHHGCKAGHVSPIFILLLWLAPLAPAAAQDRVEANPLRAAFIEMMAAPGQPDAALRYARLAAATGDARAAIIALERVLRIDPQLDNIRLELASLHLASGSPDLAAAYAREALENPDIPPDVERRGRMLLAQAERGAARSTFDVSGFVGARYDSNANEATSLGSVPIFLPELQDFVGVQVPTRGQSDWSMVLGARAQHRYDLGLQREGSWQTNAALFDQRFARIARGYDLSIASLDSGPRIGVIEGEGARLALRPFASAAWIGYGGETYAWLYGGGLTAEVKLPPRWTLELTWLGRFGNYENTEFRPRSREFTGAEQGVVATVEYAMTRDTRLSASLSYSDAEAREDWWARSGWGGSLGVTSVVELGPLGPAELATRVGVRRLRYDAPDPFINPLQSRRDTRWDAGASLVLPLGRAVALALEYGWYEQDSNYGFYSYGNHALTLGLRFGL